MKFSFQDFYFTTISDYTCRIGVDGRAPGNAAINGTSYAGPLVIPEYATDETGRKYKVIATSDYCFRGCTNLKEAKLPKTLIRLAEDTFFQTGITQLIIPRNVEVLDYAALSRMSNLETLIFEPGSKLRTLGSIQMHHNPSIKRLVFPPGVLTIGNNFFSGVSSSSKVDIIYCSPYEISNSVFSGFATVTAYVTKLYPKDKKLGNVSSNLLADNDKSCKVFDDYLRKQMMRSCHCSSCSKTKVFAIVLILSY